VIQQDTRPAEGEGPPGLALLKQDVALLERFLTE
jgi:hypothetical protein